MTKLKTLQSWLKNACNKSYSLGELKNLTRLYLYDNNLTRIPKEIMELKKLTHLYIENNNIYINKEDKKMIAFLNKFNQRWIEYTLIEETKLNKVLL